MKRLSFFSSLLFVYMFYTINCYRKDDSNEKMLKLDPDYYRNVSQLISSKGYPVEEYEVQTTDGYILGVQRIPHGRSKLHNKNKVRPVVFLQHGLLGCAADWVLNFPNQSLGFILADAGYDVWLGNQRGNTYSLRHVNYTIDDNKFWQFSFDEMAEYDLPAMIEFALNKTGQKQLYYVGHSQGTAVAFALLSERPDYKQIRAFMALGPVTTVGYINSPIRFLAPFIDEIDLVFSILGINEFLPNSVLIRYLTFMLCGSPFRIFCEDVFFLFSGIDPSQLNMTRLAVYTAHDPAGTSTQNIVHFAQMVNSFKFQKYDHGKYGNLAKYNQTTPKEYIVENIKTPIALFWGLNDIMADPVDVALLQPRIKNLIESYQVKRPTWAHLDFTFGLDAASFVYKELLKVLSKV